VSLVTVDGRSSAVHVGLPWRGLFPIPDGSLDGLNRRHVAAFYGARLLVTVTSTDNLEMPVDCVMAGNQREFKPGRAHLAALRGIFRE
jgi:hypothetical protein